MKKIISKNIFKYALITSILFFIVSYIKIITFANSSSVDNGVWKFDKQWFYVYSDNTLARNKWIDEYYVGEDGAMLTSTKTPDGYYVDKNGIKIIEQWKKDNIGWWYLNADGSYPVSEWKFISGKWYYFDEKGYMVSNRWIEDYYLSSNGDMLVNTVTPDGYGVDENGKKIPDRWIKDSVGWWYRLSNGTYPKSDWKFIDKKWYYFDEVGYRVESKWIDVYYVGSDGAMLVSTKTPDGYYVDKNGIQIIEQWKKDNIGWWYLNADGSYPISDWKFISGKWYYFDEKGYMVSNKWVGDYYLSSNGDMLVNTVTPDGYGVDENGKKIPDRWIKDSVGWWYRLSNGTYPKADWKFIDKKWYYFDEVGYRVESKWIDVYYVGSDGVMLVSTKTPDGYYVDKNGIKIVEGWKKDSIGWWYLNADGSYTISDWKFIAKKWYYFDEKGYMVSNKWIGDYYLGDDGAMCVDTWIGNYYVDANGKWVPDKKRLTVEGFQFMNLKSRTNYNADELSKMISNRRSNSVLKNKGATFKLAEEMYGVNALYLVAHAGLESAWGTSYLAVYKNNFFGIAAFDNDIAAAYKYDGVDVGILSAAKFINDNYLTGNKFMMQGAYLGNKSGGMNVYYATDPYWGKKIASIMYTLNEEMGGKDK